MSREIKNSSISQTNSIPIFYARLPDEKGIVLALRTGLFISFIPLMLFMVLLFFVIINF